MTDGIILYEDTRIRGGTHLLPSLSSRIISTSTLNSKRKHKNMEVEMYEPAENEERTNRSMHGDGCSWS